MKKIIFTLMMLICCLTAFASVKSSYSGELNVNVSGAITTIPNQTTSATESNGKVTLAIPNFTFANQTGTVTIVADIDASGNLSNPKVSFSNVPILFVSFSKPSSVTEEECNIHLYINALIDSVTVDYSGK